MNIKYREYVGNLSQLLRVETYKLEGGKKDGVKATSVSNQNGLSFTVVADRCMDISHLSYKGINLSYINPCGVVAPEFYDRTGTNWLKSFTAGFMTTCGLNNVGNPCEDNEELGLHGSIGNTPADEYCVQMLDDEEQKVVVLSGVMSDEHIFGSKLKMKRVITAFQEDNRIIIEDTIINTGFKKEEYMQLYHCNIGFPFLSPECELIVPSKSVKGANEYSQQNINCWNVIDEPSEVGEMCFIHELPTLNHTSCVGMYNNKYKMGFLLKFNNESLDKFLQWRYLNQGEYVIGLEPTTNYATGRSLARENQQLKYIGVGEAVQHRIELIFFDSKEKLLENIYCATP